MAAICCNGMSRFRQNIYKQKIVYVSFLFFFASDRKWLNLDIQFHKQIRKAPKELYNEISIQEMVIYGLSYTKTTNWNFTLISECCCVFVILFFILFIPFRRIVYHKSWLTSEFLFSFLHSFLLFFFLTRSILFHIECRMHTLNTTTAIYTYICMHIYIFTITAQMHNDCKWTNVALII